VCWISFLASFLSVKNATVWEQQAPYHWLHSQCNQNLNSTSYILLLS
jgi:hypothetical protein